MNINIEYIVPYSKKIYQAVIRNIFSEKQQKFLERIGIRYESYIRILKYLFTFGLIGSFCFLINYVFYLSFYKIFGIFIAQIFASIISASLNYILNSLINFNNSVRIQYRYYWKYLFLYIVLIVFNAFINNSFFTWSGNVKLSYWLAGIIAFFVNFIAVKAFFSRINKSVKTK